jgi:hypothetical protein
VAFDVVPDIVDAPDAVDLPATEAGGRVALRDVYFRSFVGYVEEAAGFGDANPTKGLLLRAGRRRRRRALVHQGG